MAVNPLEIVLLLGSFAVIIIGSEVFTNGIEWLGFKLRLSEGATGSVLAAVGTALPESIIPVIALLFGSTQKAGEEIGIAAILGAPFMLSTLAMFVGGTAVLVGVLRKQRGSGLLLDKKTIETGMRFFLIIFVLIIIPAFYPTPAVRWVVAATLVVLYIVYLKRIFSETHTTVQAERKLYLNYLFPANRVHGPHIITVLLQVGISLTIIVVGAKIFVDAIQGISISIGFSLAVLSFLIAPLATELPEKFNSILWYLRKKDTLAMGNVTGAMVFQSSILGALGLSVTEWVLVPVEIGSILVTLAAAAVLYAALRRGKLNGYVMLSGGVFYIVYTSIVLTGLI